MAVRYAGGQPVAGRRVGRWCGLSYPVYKATISRRGQRKVRCEYLRLLRVMVIYQYILDGESEEQSTSRVMGAADPVGWFRDDLIHAPSTCTFLSFFAPELLKAHSSREAEQLSDDVPVR